MSTRIYDHNNMPINHQLNCIFIHIPKVAGTSISRAFGFLPEGLHNLSGKITKEEENTYGLRGYGWWHHIPLFEVKKLVDQEKFDNYFKFAFVRNPWDRLISMYFYQEQTNRLENRPSFSEWLLSKPKFRCQLDYIIDENGKMGVDFVGRFESLEKDWTYIADRIGLNSRLIHVNVSRHQHYSIYYNNETKRIVAEICRKDIEAFGYQFERLGLISDTVNRIIARPRESIRMMVSNYRRVKNHLLDN
jgi:chondroitin 4-sulfotransferase 11